MAKDDYQYQIKPLPEVRPYGGNLVTHADSGSGIGLVPQFPVSSASETPSPFDNPASGGGGGGGTTPTCATNWDIGGINTSAISLPCSGSTSLITAAAVALSSGGGTAELSAVNGWVRFSNGSGQLDIDSADIDPDSGVIQLNDLDVCHLGAPGLRQFVCGDAREP